MAGPYYQIIIMIVTAVFVAACAPTPAPIPPPPTITVPPVSTAPLATPPNPQPTDMATAVPTSQPATGGTRIQVTIGDTGLTGRLWDNATARDLIAQLPLTLTFSDFNRLEKIASLPRKLSTDGVPPGDAPLPRDIGYYAPWGNLVFYYGDVGYFNGIVRIGQFDGNLDAITRQTGDFSARIELAK